MKERSVWTLLLEWTWCLPQNLLGLLFLPLSLDKGIRIGSATCRHWRLQGGISLGSFLFIQSYQEERTEKEVLLHEYGHSLESHRLGPLYLLVIGLPSFLWAFLYSFFPFFRRYPYYAFYTEAWANRLVERKRQELNGAFPPLRP